MKTHCLQRKDFVIAWVRIILAMGTNHLNFGTNRLGTKRPVSPQGLVDEIARYDAWRLPEVFPNL